MPLKDISVNQQQLEDWFAPFAGVDHIALGVSGGGDSVAMMVLIKQWLAQRRTPKVTVLSVNHNLRPEAGEEAKQACAWAQALGFQAVVLDWVGPKPSRGLQAAARTARYNLMFDWCGRHGVRQLGLAHTLDDQAETFMMRLARGSGVDGLSAMAPVSTRAGIDLVRPLLGASGQDLRDMLKAQGQPWLEDPSNEMEKFERVRVRKLLKTLQSDGFSPEKIALSAQRLGRARVALDDAARLAADECVSIYDAGFCVIDRPVLARFSDEICLRVLKTILTYCGASTLGPRLEQVEALLDKLRAETIAGCTLAGCRLLPIGDTMIIAREPGRHGLPETLLEPGARQIWDNRFEVALSAQANDALNVQALGGEGWLGVKKMMKTTRLRASLGHNLISFWRNDTLVAVPHLDFYANSAVRDTLTARACAPRAFGSVNVLATKLDDKAAIFTNFR